MSIHDAALAGRVRNALSTDTRVSGLPIDIRVSGDEVYLKGVVESSEQLEVVKFILGGVSGVRHVNIEEIRTREETR
jgi:osmotically-inducible protein OsmY